MAVLLLILPILHATYHLIGIQQSRFRKDFNRKDNNACGDESLDSQIFALNNNTILSSTISLRSQVLTLNGYNHTLLCAFSTQDNTNHVPTPSMSRKYDENLLQYMFTVSNSSFCVSYVKVIIDTGSTGVCSISGSTVRFSASSIVSNGIWSPFLVQKSDYEDDPSGSAIVLAFVSHITPSAFLPPLVDISHPKQSTQDLSSGVHECVSVTGISLILEDKSLSSGTGPLFTFGLAQQSRQVSVGHVLKMETAMISSMLVNMSSPSAPSRRHTEESLFGSNVNQKMVGCSVVSSVNHQRGTSMLDPNMGGSLHCQNSSFSSCITESNAEQEIVLKDHTQGDQFTSAAVTSPTVVFRLCTFNDMLSAADGDENGGAGIFLKLTSASLEVSQCSFHRCVASGKDNDGAAIIYTCSSSNKKPFKIEKSSFTECQSTGNHLTSTSAAFVSTNSQSTTVPDCFFRHCNATGRCATVYLLQTSAILSNCVFVECASLKSYGAAIGLRGMTSIQLNSIIFRKCSASVAGSSDLAYFTMSTTLLNSTSIQLCDSTSGSPNIFNADSTQKDGTLIPQVTKATFIATFKMTFEGEKCVVEIGTASAVSGSMGVLLGGANVPRLIHIPFGSSSSSSSSGTTEVTTGSQGLLPTLAGWQSYSLQSVAISGYDISPSVFAIVPTLIDTSTVSLKLSGYSVPIGESMMIVKNSAGSTFSIDLTFSSETELLGSSGVAASESGKLKFEEEYHVTSIAHHLQTILFSTPLSFTVPCPPAILSSFTPTTDNDWMTLVFSGSGLVADSYTLTLTEQNPSGTAHTKEVILSRTSDLSLDQWNITLFPSISADLKYGTKYNVSKMESSIAVQSVTLPSFVITTPTEPSRVLGITLERYSDSDKLAEFIVDGVAMVKDTTYTLIVNETGTNTQTSFDVRFSSTTTGTGSAVLFSSSSSSIQLKFDTDYTVTGVKDSAGQDVLFMSGLSFTTKQEPTRLVTFTSFHDAMVRN
ncbi:hypothetical protein BLNAU_8393 [Blattamonas nauphoetae]|uniref:Transmembrane protein n=1 Tax=Blattamonas nauphoetae TaxID=2049346 RepID=A0ABQ9XYJ0_9EUKA|nr:hypothetical protein BLNAU_8393 [Blattamonas nauphoetae]